MNIKINDMVEFSHKWNKFITHDMGVVKDITEDKLLIDNNVNEYWILKKEVEEVW